MCIISTLNIYKIGTEKDTTMDHFIFSPLMEVERVLLQLCELNCYRYDLKKLDCEGYQGQLRVYALR